MIFRLHGDCGIATGFIHIDRDQKRIGCKRVVKPLEQGICTRTLLRWQSAAGNPKDRRFVGNFAVAEVGQNLN